jgi:hypothetical protein
MIKLTYEQKQYEYKNVGCQPYDIKTVMELKEDANIEEAIAMYLDFLKIAGYRLDKEKLIEAIEEYILGNYYN